MKIKSGHEGRVATGRGEDDDRNDHQKENVNKNADNNRHGLTARERRRVCKKSKPERREQNRLVSSVKQVNYLVEKYYHRPQLQLGLYHTHSFMYNA